ncbi:MAG: Gx transporter family protein, partial [Endomicrobiia bacterium]
VVCAILLGNFGSSMFVISFLSSIFSIILMSGTKFLFEKFLSNIGVSIIGAVGHNLCQLIIVYFLFINNKTIFLLLPILILAGVIFGFITGYLVNRILLSLPENVVLGKINFLSQEVNDNNDKNVKENLWYYILIPLIVIATITIFNLIKNVSIIIVICLILLVKKFLIKTDTTIEMNFLKKSQRINFFIYIFFGIIFVNVFSVILYGYTAEQTVVLLKNIFVSLLKLLTFILLTQELFSLKYVATILINFPLIFKSMQFVNIILPKLEIKDSFKITSFLEKLLIKDVFSN